MRNNKELTFRFKRDKRLTKKQLYGYSYMKWDLLRKEVRELSFGYCSFCYDAMKQQDRTKSHDKSMCIHCLIDHKLCGEYTTNSTYNTARRGYNAFFYLVHEMCTELLRRYDDEEK